ncbi:MAG: DUF3604 domain-containing protein [Candidatus Tectomicrobia bacterium]
MSANRTVTVALVTLFVSFAIPPAFASEPPPEAASLEKAFDVDTFSPYANRAFPSQVFWGDTHLHTSISLDAGAFGARLMPEDAYRLALGEEITSSTGVPVKLSRPLDFLAVADHSDNMGLFSLLFEGDPGMTKSDIGRELSTKIRAGGRQGVEAALYIIKNFANNELDDELLVLPDSKAYKNTWDTILDAAEKYNDPGRFTALIGYEWTSLIAGNNMHRVVLYRDDASFARQIVPYTATAPHGSTNPRDLWKWLASYEDKTGGDVLAIAHNGNLSNGIMFPYDEQFNGRFGGKVLDKEYVEQRIAWEPLYEITQMKGDGEAHPFLSPNDEFADYETWDKANLNMSEANEKSMLPGQYAREALKRGLEMEGRFGTNPYKFGIIGATDSHTGLATAGEDNFFGKHSGTEPNPKRLEHVVAQFGNRRIEGWEQVASGLAGVWAKENTREAIFDALERKEVYGTTGPRMLVRFFGGWEFTDEDALGRNPGFAGYDKGVTMGGDLTKAPAGKSPSFLVAALKDPLSGNLDRIQIIKGWTDAKGNPQERVYDVAVSDGRTIDSDGRCRTPVGDTVDVARATWTNTIGDPELITVWKDPDFDPDQRAVYYARVIEIPTPRWTAYEAVRYGIKVPKEAPMKTQERAYTSPIWYTP